MMVCSVRLIPASLYTKSQWVFVFRLNNERNNNEEVKLNYD